jgi:HEAT repeat protein
MVPPDLPAAVAAWLDDATLVPGAGAIDVAVLAPPAPSRRELLGALGGLAEVGTPADAAIAAPHMASGDPRIRAEAVRCVGALDPDRYRAEIEQAAASPLRRVRLEAARALGGGRRR